MSEQSTKSVTVVLDPLMAAQLEVRRQELILVQKRAKQEAAGLQGKLGAAVEYREPSLEDAARHALYYGLHPRTSPIGPMIGGPTIQGLPDDIDVGAVPE